MYHAKITREGKHHLAEFIDAPGCQTFAGSRTALLVAAKEALEGWLETHLQEGDAPPKPKRVRGGDVVSIEIDLALRTALELRWARLASGMTQAELAQKAGVSQQQIARLERPGANPSVGTIERVAAALGVRAELSLRAG